MTSEILFLVFSFFFVIIPVIQFILEDRKSITGSKTVLVLFSLFLLFFCLYVLSIFLSMRNIYFAGYRSMSFLFLAMSFFALLFLLFFLCRAGARLFKGLFATFAIVFFIFSVFLSVQLSGDFERDLLYEDGRYRLEYPLRGFMEPCHLPVLFIKNGVFERKHIFENENEGCFTKDEVRSVLINEAGNDTISVKIYHTDTSRIPSPVIRYVSVR